MSQTITICHVEIEQDDLSPWAVLPFFKLVRRLAVEHGMPDVSKLECSVKVVFSGPEPEAQGEAFKRELDEMWINAWLDKEIRELRS